MRLSETKREQRNAEIHKYYAKLCNSKKSNGFDRYGHDEIMDKMEKRFFLEQKTITGILSGWKQYTPKPKQSTKNKPSKTKKK